MTLQSCDLKLQFFPMNYGIIDVHLLRRDVFHMYFQRLTPLMAHAHKRGQRRIFLDLNGSKITRACYFKVANDKAWSSLAIYLLHKCGIFLIYLFIFSF